VAIPIFLLFPGVGHPKSYQKNKVSAIIHNMKETDEKVNALIESLDKVEAQTRKLTSLKRRFLIGLVMGLGTVIGATILVALVGYTLTLFAKFGIFPGINEWIAETIR